MKKLSVCILFGGVSPEHKVSLRSAESVLNHIDKSKYQVFPVGIDREGSWILFGGDDYSELPADTWAQNPKNCPAESDNIAAADHDSTFALDFHTG